MGKKKKGGGKPQPVVVTTVKNPLPKRVHHDQVKVFTNGKTKSEFRNLKKRNPELTRKAYLAF